MWLAVAAKNYAFTRYIECVDVINYRRYKAQWWEFQLWYICFFPSSILNSLNGFYYVIHWVDVHIQRIFYYSW